ncbi:histamine N-methyltransferase-like [Saccoglossus kowalevskii]|uniref:Histamine N-methyltransferase-like n=1 Tax=Saccoglossus kowalevskii TaxID=10224 RepID=A0ABM0GYY7_SACKO|nr:PREDICTED: histamine N-methyltransferase-like [Saccoglossus kowalevskii]
MATTSDDLLNHMKEYHKSFQTVLNYGLKSRELRYKEDAIKTVHKLRLESCIDEVRVLSIGSGKGDVDLHFINALVYKYTAIHYTVVEPATGPLDEFKRLIESNQERWRGVKFSFHVQGINEYLEGGGTSDKYDVILACHSFYCFRNAGNTLRYLYDMLSKDGMLLIRVDTDGGWLKYLNYRNKFQLSRKHISGVEAKKLTYLQFPHGSIEILRNTNVVTVTKCFDKDSKNGNRMLDFFTEVFNFRNARPPDEVEECLRYFRDECCYVKADEILIDVVEEDIIIWKNGHT